jgi:hypothetical protein
MTDLSTIKGSTWHTILRDWRNGAVDRAAIIRALDSHEPVPDAVKPLLAGLLAKTIKATRGNKRDPRVLVNRAGAATIKQQIADVAALLKKPQGQLTDDEAEALETIRALRGEMRRPGQTAHKVALAEVARWYSTKPGALKKKLEPSRSPRKVR